MSYLVKEWPNDVREFMINWLKDQGLNIRNNEMVNKEVVFIDF